MISLKNIFPNLFLLFFVLFLGLSYKNTYSGEIIQSADVWHAHLYPLLVLSETKINEIPRIKLNNLIRLNKWFQNSIQKYRQQNNTLDKDRILLSLRDWTIKVFFQEDRCYVIDSSEMWGCHAHMTSHAVYYNIPLLPIHECSILPQDIPHLMPLVMKKIRDQADNEGVALFIEKDGENNFYTGKINRRCLYPVGIINSDRFNKILIDYNNNPFVCFRIPKYNKIFHLLLIDKLYYEHSPTCLDRIAPLKELIDINQKVKDLCEHVLKNDKKDMMNPTSNNLEKNKNLMPRCYTEKTNFRIKFRQTKSEQRKKGTEKNEDIARKNENINIPKKTYLLYTIPITFGIFFLSLIIYRSIITNAVACVSE